MDDQPSPDSVFLPPYDVKDPSIQDIFADNAYMYLTNSSASITFTLGYGTPQGEEKPTVRIHMSHDVLIRLSNLVATRAAALLKMYGDNVPTLAVIDPALVKQVIADMIKPVSNDV